MKKQLFTTIFILAMNYTFSQNHFSTTTVPFNSSLNLSHHGTFTLGSTYESINDPWRAGEGRLLHLYKPNGNVSFKLGSSIGSFSINVASNNGAFFPSANPGDIILRKHTAKKVYFSLKSMNMFVLEQESTRAPAHTR